LVLAAQSRFPEAEQALRSALKIGEDNSQALTVLAMVLARTGRQAEAVSYFRKIIALDPKVPGPHMNLGITLADQFNLEGALDEFSEATRLDPNAAAAHYNKGRVLLDLRRDSDAKPELEAATRLDPRSAQIRGQGPDLRLALVRNSQLAWCQNYRSPHGAWWS
jgi:Flp pilus assembly protein TadD